VRSWGRVWDNPEWTFCALSYALGLAGTCASGLRAFLADGAKNKRFHTGVASHDGVLAAELAFA